MRIMPFMKRKNGVQFAGAGLDTGTGGGGGGGNTDYSTDEHLIGKKWIDGKDIYAKTWHITSLQNPQPLVGVLNVENIISYELYCRSEYGSNYLRSYFSNALTMGGRTIKVLPELLLQSHTLQLESDITEGSTWRGSDFYVTIEYTKLS